MRVATIWRRGAAGLFLALAMFLTGCTESGPSRPVAKNMALPSILLVTLDTTRADSIGPEARGIDTPAFNALAARGRRFRYAYATTPQTLPSHTSILTGLYPAAHGVHENGRYLRSRGGLLAEELKARGYRTAAFVSAFALARQFGLARGFDVYDDAFGAGQAQRSAAQTTDRALAFLDRPASGPLFLWVHYYDPHYPYEPPEPFRSRFRDHPYLGEIATMDQQLGRLIEAFERRAAGPRAVLVVADHGEGLGDHGEQQHGNLLYQETMRVPLVLVGPGITPGVEERPVSIRHVYHTIRAWAGLGREGSILLPQQEVVAGEAMKPFLDYGWKPQVMAVEGRTKAILSGRVEVYDLHSDPGEVRDIAVTTQLSRPIRTTLRDYPIPSPGAAEAAPQNEEERRKLASLGYVASSVAPVVRPGAPRAVDMAPLFPVLDLASGFFVRGQYAEAIPLLRRIRKEDPGNLDAALRLGVALSALGQSDEALRAFRDAEAIAPQSRDVQAYLALYYARGPEWKRAVPILERLAAEEPDRVAVLEALEALREREDRLEEAVAIRERINALRPPTGPELSRLGEMQMALGRTSQAIAAFEGARSLMGSAFDHHLELGVLYLAARRLEDSARELDQVPSSNRGYPMALFKRAQVSVLLGEADREKRIATARRHADPVTRELIAHERLFSQ